MNKLRVGIPRHLNECIAWVTQEIGKGCKGGLYGIFTSGCQGGWEFNVNQNDLEQLVHLSVDDYIPGGVST